MPLMVENLSVSRGGTEVIRDVSFTIEAGEVVAIIGESGVGKTTLIRAILGLEQYSHGLIRAVGRSVSLPTSPMGRRMIDVRSNMTVFFGPDSLRPYETVMDRVRRLAAGTRKKSALSWGPLAERLGLTSLLWRYPHQLSMGEKARAGVLACLASNRKIILLDEFGSNLDDRTQRELFAAAAHVASLGTAIGIVSHSRLLTQEIATRTFEIKQRLLRQVQYA